MMIRASSESHLNDAKQNLAECMDYGIKACRIEPDFFSVIFLQSGYDEQFEGGNPAVIAGMSGVELARRIISHAYPDYSFPAELARLFGVKIRSIQLYEQRVNDIDRAQAGTLYKLSRVLGCTVEDLLVSPERMSE